MVLVRKCIRGFSESLPHVTIEFARSSPMARKASNTPLPILGSVSVEQTVALVLLTSFWSG